MTDFFFWITLNGTRKEKRKISNLLSRSLSLIAPTTKAISSFNMGHLFDSIWFLLMDHIVFHHYVHDVREYAYEFESLLDHNQYMLTKHSIDWPHNQQELEEQDDWIDRFAERYIRHRCKWQGWDSSNWIDRQRYWSTAVCWFSNLRLRCRMPLGPQVTEHSLHSLQGLTGHDKSFAKEIK